MSSKGTGYRTGDGSQYGNPSPFRVVVESLLARGCHVRFRASGLSMQPAIRDGETVTLAPLQMREPRRGDVVLSNQAGRLVAHRLVGFAAGADGRIDFVLRGDASSSCDAPVDREAILARVITVDRHGRPVDLDSFAARAAYFWLRQAADIRQILERFWRLRLRHTEFARRCLTKKQKVLSDTPPQQVRAPLSNWSEEL